MSFHSKLYLAVVSYYFLVKAKYQIEFWHLKKIIALNSKKSKGSNSHKDSLDDVKTICGFVKKLSNYTPFESNCYNRALAAKMILNRKNIDSIIHYGVMEEKESQQLKGHIWLEFDGKLLLGGYEAIKYNEVFKFN